MASTPQRLRSSTAPSQASPGSQMETELQPLVFSLLHLSSQELETGQFVSRASRHLQQIRQILVDNPQVSTKDAFRRLQGFEALLQVLGCLGSRQVGVESNAVSIGTFIELSNTILGVVAEGLEDHHKNRRYFSEWIRGSGWNELERVLLRCLRTTYTANSQSINIQETEELFGLLFAFAMKDDAMRSLYTNIHRRGSARMQEKSQPSSSTEDESTAKGRTQKKSCSDEDKGPEQRKWVEELVRRALGDRVLLKNPEILPMICRLWSERVGSADEHDPLQRQLSTAILKTLHEMLSSSKRNLYGAHASGIIGLLLPPLFDHTCPQADRSLLRQLVDLLITAGLPSMKEAFLLYQKALSSSECADFLLSSLRSSRIPPHVLFDFSVHGYASIELPSLGRPFPPTSSSAGYSFAVWIQIERFDPNLHTTIFGAFDSSQTCFVLAYIEKDTHNFILQTSITSSRPSVRFKSKTFEAGRWYHIAVIHARPRTTSSSKAALFVDGEFVEQLQCHYPSSPPVLSSNMESLTSISAPPKRHAPVQAFLGTPQDLSTRLGPGAARSQWSLASFHLFEEVLSRDLISVYYRLGPRYTGNFQDCLGSFQTYEASAALNLRNETLYAGKTDSSPLVSAIRSKAGSILPEQRILLSISASAVLTIGDQRNFWLMKALSKRSFGNLKHLTRYGNNAVIINGAVPSINEALLQPHGVAVMTGDPVVMVPSPLDDVSWRVGGCVAVGLKMVEVAETRESVVRAVEILFESVRDNWRNSEATERGNAFGILAVLLSRKMDAASSSLSTNESSSSIKGGAAEAQKLSFQLLSIILGFVGLKHQQREESVINNALAYRILLVDTDMWRRTAFVTQNLYYDQFVLFGVESRHQPFNWKRLSKMHIVKRFLNSLKTEPIQRALIPQFSKVFRMLLDRSSSGEVFRSLSLFVTYSLYRGRSAMRKSHRESGAAGRPPSGTITNGSRLENGSTSGDAQECLSYSELGILILEIYSDLLCTTQDANIKKFARTVTNRWLLHLLADDNPTVVRLGLKILARLFVAQGSSYITKFAQKSSGFEIMKHQLSRWWAEPGIWSVLFALLFGSEISSADGQHLQLETLRTRYLQTKTVKVKHPEVLSVMVAMLGAGLNNTVEESTFLKPTSRDGHVTIPGSDASTNKTTNKLAVAEQQIPKTSSEASGGDGIIDVAIWFLGELYHRSPSFQTFAASSSYLQELLWILTPVISPAEPIDAETELHCRASTVTLDPSADRPSSAMGPPAPTSLRQVSVNGSPSSGQRPRPIGRLSSFILVSSHRPRSLSSISGKSSLASNGSTFDLLNGIGPPAQLLVKLFLDMLLHQVFERKDFPGFSLFLKAPPGYPEQTALLEFCILQTAVRWMRERSLLNQKTMCEPRVITNLASVATHLLEAMLEGSFEGYAELVLEFTGSALEYYQQPEVAVVKSVRLCSQSITTIKLIMLEAVLLQLSKSDNTSDGEKIVAFLNKMLYWQQVLFEAEEVKPDFLHLLSYQLHLKLEDPRKNVRTAAAGFWRIMLMQKPAVMSRVLDLDMTSAEKDLLSGFERLQELDDDAFLAWRAQHRKELDAAFTNTFATAWEKFITAIRKKGETIAKSRGDQRKEKLKQWAMDEATLERTLHQHKAACHHMAVNIYAAERLKHQRALQDQQDNTSFLISSLKKLESNLKGPSGLIGQDAETKWRLDQTEGRNRMRLRMIPDVTDKKNGPETKRPRSQSQPEPSIKSPSPTRPASYVSSLAPDPGLQPVRRTYTDRTTRGGDEQQVPDSPVAELDEEFEMVDDPREDGDGFEDKNRTVIRSLQRGDQIQHVYNVSRIIGLEACEGLLILGKDFLYLLDGVFQRSDGEIVGVSQAPKDERDAYLQMISGRQTEGERQPKTSFQRDSRQWRWSDVVSISKRRFLFRDVAIEVFFTDGRSYLLTGMSPETRNELFNKLTESAPHVSGSSASRSPEDLWRLETLTCLEEHSHSFGSKLANVFQSGYPYAATRRWARGEISNFHYLMLVNTMAGRTFNDLTQYPVFPWVLADYTSDELDLTDAETFRDLSKPMGAQNPLRESEFQSRYRTFAELEDHNAPPFHYGTHYSSAMIVTSYLVRLQPFVQSFLLLQGGNFDHADRMFHSIEQAWTSASRAHMTDVRELIPEFFYLPEFLENMNGYNFGVLQKNGHSIDSVTLPPWAKGDPKIFIAKHREALESPYVRQHLPGWIDLVFGWRQQGEAAVKATNVFHHLSYHGAKDLDTIEDPVERVATIGIIHNFGQTPHQVFQKPHPLPDNTPQKRRRLDTAIEGLTRLPTPLLESGERVASLLYSTKHERLLCAGAFRLNMPPDYDRHMEWGFVDDSVRFYQADNRKMVGLFEHMHQRQLSCAMFADSKTLITAGLDCTIAVWTVTASAKTVDLQPKATLFGLLNPVTILAISRSYSTLLSVTSEGQASLWDLNRLLFIRCLADDGPVESARINDVTGDVVLCYRQTVVMYTLNGQHILTQRICREDDIEDSITCCAFYDGVGNEWLNRELFFTGHRRGIVNVWAKIIHNGKFKLELIRTLDNRPNRPRHRLPPPRSSIDSNYSDNGNSMTGNNGSVMRVEGAGISCILPTAYSVYTGDEDGRVYEWTKGQ